MRARLVSALRRLEQDAAQWREEPMKRIAIRNKPLRPLRVRQFQYFGENSLIDRPMWLYGAKHISIGAHVTVLRGAWLAVERSAWDQPGPALQIGDRTGIRGACTISASSSVVIEEDVGMGGGITIVDSRHTWSSGHPNAFYSPSESAPIRIGRGTWLADRASVVAGAQIGEQCLIGANTLVGGNVPDFSIVIGVPGRVVGSTRT
jgi:acetyltransferase-like isoleucine patch superfamily enzyme